MKNVKNDDRVKRILMVSLKHRLLAPIDAIVGYSEMLLEDDAICKNECICDDLENIQISGKHLLSYVKTTLEKHNSDAAEVDSLEFGARVRHEMRTHLNHIIGYSEILIEEAEDEGLSELAIHLEKILSSSKNLLAYIDEILDLSKIQAGVAMLDFDSNTALMSQDVAQTIRPLSNNENTKQITGRVLVVDDIEMNRDIVAIRLKRVGHQVISATTGQEALDMLDQHEFDLVILDIMMPDINGYQVLQKIMENDKLKDLPVIMLSALAEVDSVVRCLDLGAEDYLVKPINQVVLLARVNSCVEKKQLKDREQLYYQALQQKQQELADELAEAADYVKSLLPPPMDAALTTQWRFVPSSQLGGDSFGYHWIDDNYFSLYLLDVCGHGVGSALLSVSIMNVLQTNTLQNADIRNPGEIMSALNDTFRMENQNGKYFSIWYGVFDNAKRELTYSCCGHPPAILALSDGDQHETIQLDIGGSAITGFSDESFPSASVHVKAESKLYVFSDGIYEITDNNGRVASYTDFLRIMKGLLKTGTLNVDTIVATMETMDSQDTFLDDVSLLEVVFH